MKTKDFITMLQRADPDGEGHIRMSGGVPMFAEAKPGYYDGAYSYFDEEGNYVTSTRDYKVDIHTEDGDDLIWDNCNIHEPGNKEKVMSMFKFDSPGTIGDHREKRNAQLMEQYSKTYDEVFASMMKNYEGYLTKMLEAQNRGCRFFQKIDGTYYEWKMPYPDGKEEWTCGAAIEPILHSGRWHRITSKFKEGYYEWIFKGEGTS